MIGTRLSHYDILEEISRGGMGVVYRAVDTNLGREVALKVLPEDLVHDSDRRERLLQEARAASALEHPHIAVIHEVGEAGGVTFIAMELIRGEKLSQTLERGPLPPPRALALTTEIGEALARAHEKGIVHRDVKPANVMVTDDGHVKVIDFGLAKLVEAPPDQQTASLHGGQTRPGVILGTAAYMSPEQARGVRVDHRSDVFALGVTLYEMLTGRPAFQGPSSLDTLQAVLTQPVPPLPQTAALPADANVDLQRIIAKATAKDPDDRYQGMKDLIVDVRAARRRLESSQTFTVSAPAATARSGAGGRRLATVLAAVAITAAAGGAAFQWWRGRHASLPPASPSGRPSVAVLYFENNTGDKSLDWMRTGLTDMIVTDLSQSEDFEVVGTDRLVQILQDLRRADDRVLSADVVQEIANRAAVDKVLVGSYVKAGGTIRISARLQEPRSGKILSGESVEGAGEASVFGLVDELTRRFKTQLAAVRSVPSAPMLNRPGEAKDKAEAGLDRGVTEITTSSIEAYRYYAEGINFHERGLFAQAIPLLEKAVAIDPDFAMAYAKLAVDYGNLAALEKRDEYSRKALERTDRLTTRERYYIEGFYYSNQPETVGRAIEAYQQGLKLHPEHQASRHNLGLIFGELERYPEAIAQYEDLVRRRVSNPTTYENLATLLIETGDVQRARQVADDFVRQYPDNAAGQRMLGLTFMAADQLDDARAAFDKSAALDPLDVLARMFARSVAVLQDRWRDAQAIDDELARSPNAFARFQGLIGDAFVAVAQGKRQVALDLLDRAVRVPQLSRQPRAATRNRMAQMLLRDGKAAAALAQADLAVADARGRPAEYWALQLQALAQQAVGRTAESSKTLALLEARANNLPSDREKRRVRWLRGQLALAGGDTTTAIRELSQAVKMLPPKAPPNGPPNIHLDLLYDAAVALTKAGRDGDAAPLLERIQSGYEREFGPEPWARSFYLLGQIYERRGDAAKARDQYKRFLELWRDGDLERGWVAEAAKKVGS
jgi:eukaryotic-like serine/threonine-protein kinase